MKIVSSLILIFGLSFFGRVVVASNFIEVARNSNASDEELSTASGKYENRGNYLS